MDAAKPFKMTLRITDGYLPPSVNPWTFETTAKRGLYAALPTLVSVVILHEPDTVPSSAFSPLRITIDNLPGHLTADQIANTIVGVLVDARDRLEWGVGNEREYGAANPPPCDCAGCGIETLLLKLHDKVNRLLRQSTDHLMQK